MDGRIIQIDCILNIIILLPSVSEGFLFLPAKWLCIIGLKRVDMEKIDFYSSIQGEAGVIMVFPKYMMF